VIEPFLGPYKVIKNTSKNCPKKLNLTAMCTLGELMLGSVADPDFVFMNFEGINMGNVEKKINGRLIEVQISKFENLIVTSKKRIYLWKGNVWLEHMRVMSLKNNKLKLTKVRSVEGQTPKSILDCEYVVDPVERKRMYTEFEAMVEASKKNDK
jgi:hypothetical protein